uniref:Uncharacterized protein n=1 Tax=Thuretia quercifolia TaxID=189650 RepID=A0A1Z1MKS8_9FLOR|nr:hypothetical protein [Thuretia quercifolia]ARW66344.1 hypothetical protein [Thuretia quercifolia]
MTLTDCFSKTFSIDNSLKLWLKSQNRQIIIGRKIFLYD